MTTTLTETLHTQRRTIDGLSIRYAESEPKAQHALLLSPWPESIYCYESIWNRLAEQVHLVAIDLPGFGQSEARESLMSPRAMGDFLIRVADEFELEQPHLVGPDIGTSASLFAAARLPHRFASLVIGCGGAAVPLDLGGVLKEWVEAPSLDPYRAMGGEAIVTAVMATLERHQLSKAAREDYLASYAGDRFAESMRFVQSYPRQLPILGDLLPTIDTPVLVIAGARDPVVPRSNAIYLEERLPRSRVEFLDALHFIWEDAADDYAALVAEWWASGFASLGSRTIT